MDSTLCQYIEEYKQPERLGVFSQCPNLPQQDSKYCLDHIDKIRIIDQYGIEYMVRDLTEILINHRDLSTNQIRGLLRAFGAEAFNLGAGKKYHLPNFEGLTQFYSGEPRY